MPREMRNAGPPITEFWAWIVTDGEGREAVAGIDLGNGPVAACGPDRENVAADAIETIVRHRYANLRVELRRFVAA